LKGYIKRLKRGGLYVFLLMCMFLLAFRSRHVINGLQEAMRMCYQTVIPSLFPFFVVSGLLVKGGFAHCCARLLSPIMKPLFSVNGAGALPFVIGLISGYPMGAGIIAELRKKGMLTKVEAERLLPFCNNAGPLFVIGAVGGGMLHSVQDGMFLYGIHGLCALVVGFFFRFYKRSISPIEEKGVIDGQQHNTFLQTFSESVSGAVQTMLMVCGYILFFSAVTSVVTPFLNQLLPTYAAFWIRVVLEVTGGAFSISKAGFSHRFLLAAMAFCIGTGGLCVMMQVAGLVTQCKVSLKTYAVGKLLQGVLSAVCVYSLYPFIYSEKVSTFAPFVSHQTTTIMEIMGTCGNLFALLACIGLCISVYRIKK